MDASADCGENAVAGESVVRPSFLHDVHGKLTIATKHKEEGTEYFKAGNYKKAISCYAKVTAFTRYALACFVIAEFYNNNNSETIDNLQWTSG